LLKLVCRGGIIISMEQLRKNEIFEADIEAYNSEGSGVARICGRAVFVPRTIVGERWRIVIVKVTSSAVYGRAIEAVRLSEERRTPECEKYLRCGGCTMQHMSYEEELRFKKQRVNDALEHIGRQSVRLESIIGSRETSRYRNKGIYAIRECGGRACKGFFAARSHELVAVENCLIQSEIADRTADAVVRFINENGLRAYNEETRRGLIKHVYVRRAVNTPDAVAVIVAAGGFGDRTSSFVEYLRTSCPELTGIVLNVNKTSGNTVLAGKFYTLWGRDFIRDSLGGIEYELAPQAFYQINPPQAERLYLKAVEYAQPEGKTVLDMYCGAGTISLFLAKTAKRVIGAEIIPEAVQNARENARCNGIENAEFICADASEAAEQFLKGGIHPDAVVVDPPRKGMDEAAVRALCGMNPERVVYVSCNPATLARDIKVFNDCGYTLRRAESVDMFPRTTHVETVVLMSRVAKKGLK
jgi:23S rRNA (uracil1939-C5)-methyltransferase